MVLTRMMGKLKKSELISLLKNTISNTAYVEQSIEINGDYIVDIVIDYDYLADEILKLYEKEEK